MVRLFGVQECLSLLLACTAIFDETTGSSSMYRHGHPESRLTALTAAVAGYRLLRRFLRSPRPARSMKSAIPPSSGITSSGLAGRHLV